MFVFNIPGKFWLLYFVVLIIGMLVLYYVGEDNQDLYIFIVLVILVIFFASITISIDNWVDEFGNAPPNYAHGSVGAASAMIFLSSVIAHQQFLKLLTKRFKWLLVRGFLFILLSICMHIFVLIFLIFLSAVVI